jgi:ABC-type nitrate/sulfonate/bicarbonate transport system substrate-binding protein
MKHKRLLALLLGFALLVVACGGDDEPAATSQATVTTQATQETAPTETPTETAPPEDEMMDADATIADIRSRIEGQSVVVGSSGFPNASLTGAFRTMDFLRDDFGLDVEFRLLDSDPLVAATIAGEVAVGQLSLAGMANAVSAGSDFVAFGGDDQKNSFIIAAKAPISSMEELRGQPVAATQSLNQITGQTLQKCLADVGMTVDDVQLVRLAHTGEATQAITSGQVVGGISATWRLTQLTLNEGEGAYNMLCAGWESNPQISSVWYAERAWVEANPDIALAFNIASLKSARWAQDDKQRWIDYAMSVNERLTPEAASLDYDNLIDELDMWPVNGSLDYDLMQTTLDTSFSFEAVDREYTVEELVTFEFQDKALEILGSA